MLEIANHAQAAVNRYHLWRVEKNVISLNNVSELKKVFGWGANPVIDDATLHDFEVIEDVNERRLRDAEVLGTVCCNVNSKNLLEIGTATGRSTALMSINAPSATVFTLNILPEELHDGKGGRYNTFALEKEKIGSYYREKGLKNIVQIYANTATWKPALSDVGASFIDGCHDTKYVINDTKKALQCMTSGAFILWHDFHPGLTRKYNWIQEVCSGVEKLLARKVIQGRIFHVKDSWIGVYRVP